MAETAINNVEAARLRMMLLLSYHRRLRMILRSARAARGRRSGYSQLVYVCGSHGNGGLDWSRDGADVW